MFNKERDIPRSTSGRYLEECLEIADDCSGDYVKKTGADGKVGRGSRKYCQQRSQDQDPIEDRVPAGVQKARQPRKQE
jgi:hypothetical protein